MRHWGFKSDVWKLKQAIVNAQKAREARAEQDRLLQAHMLSVQMQKTALQNPVSIPDDDFDCDDANDLEDIEMKMGMVDDEEFDAMLAGDMEKDESESSIKSGSANFYYDTAMLVNPNEVWDHATFPPLRYAFVLKMPIRFICAEFKQRNMSAEDVQTRELEKGKRAFVPPEKSLQNLDDHTSLAISLRF